MDFRTYKASSAKTDKNTDINADLNAEKKQGIKALVDEYSSKSEDALYEELAARYKKEVEEGRMSEEKLKQITSVIGAYLNDTQKEKLGKIIEKLGK